MESEARNTTFVPTKGRLSRTLGATLACPRSTGKP
jgi:hypothetical protein